MSLANWSALELRFRFFIGLVCVTIFIGGVIWITVRDSERNTAYPDVQSNESINDKILSIETERGFARIEFESGTLRTVYFARNNSYAPSDLSFFLKKGDVFLKRADNDTVKIVRNDVTFVFRLGKEIQCCK